MKKRSYPIPQRVSGLPTGTGSLPGAHTDNYYEGRQKTRRGLAAYMVIMPIVIALFIAFLLCIGSGVAFPGCDVAKKGMKAVGDHYMEEINPRFVQAHKALKAQQAKEAEEGQ